MASQSFGDKKGPAGKQFRDGTQGKADKDLRADVEAAFVSVEALTAAAIHGNLSGEILAVALKVTPVGADMILIEDSAAGNAKKRITVGSLPTGGGVYGTEYESDLATTYRSTTTQVWAEVQKLTTAVKPAGTYRIEWNYIWANNFTGSNFQCRVTVDDATQLYAQTQIFLGFNEHRQKPANSVGAGDGSTDQRHITSCWADVTFAVAATHDIDIDISSGVLGIRASIYRSTISIYRVA